MYIELEEILDLFRIVGDSFANACCRPGVERFCPVAPNEWEVDHDDQFPFLGYVPAATSGGPKQAYKK
jgi:hypothetical protein